jgi:cell division transport system permease protein
MRRRISLVRPSRDLPLERDATARFLPWIIAFIVFLAALALAASMVVDGALGSWNRGLSNTLTVQVPPLLDGTNQSTARIDAALAVLRATPGVTKAERITDEKIKSLLEPWLGKTLGAADLPLPALIGVEVSSPQAVDLELLSHRLQSIAPDISVDSHRLWLDALVGRARIAQFVALGIVLLNALAAIATVIFATRTGLMVHAAMIEVLHLMGATDRYIARQFAGQALRLGLRGGLIFIVPALMALLLLTQGGGLWGGDGGGGILGLRVHLAPVQWAVLLIVPLIAAAIAVLTARRTVLAMLAKLP